MELDPQLKNIYGKSGEEDLFIVNELHKAREFRKIHIETALFGESLEILHAVFFPYPEYDLPIFGVDLVAVPTGVPAAIVDISPSREKLPETIEKELRSLNFPSFSNVRKLPIWGDIFSPYVQFLSPKNAKEYMLFLGLVDSFLKIIISYSASIEADPSTHPKTIERYEFQKYYCSQQKLNDKTRSVLSKAFNPHWANEYIDMVLFDSPQIAQY